jgi:CRISPR-associated endonuclease Csn1
LEPGEKRCPRGDWYARRFRILQNVNNLKIRSRDGSERPLTNKERSLILEDLGAKIEVSFSSLRKKLQKEFGDAQVYETTSFNLEEEGRRERLRGDGFAAAMAKILGRKRWSELPEEEKVNINTALLELDDDSFSEAMVKRYELTTEQVEKMLDIELPGKYTHFSRKAIQKLLPYMEQGYTEPDAEKEVYGNRADNQDTQKKESEKLGLPPNLRNPLVQSALCEVRKLLGSLIQAYGKPSKIVIEMARDVKGSKEERLALQEKMRENERVNRKAIEELRKAGYEPSAENILKYKLWEECGYRCVYTGRSISATALFGSSSEFQIEHILPYKRTLDDSYMNKTLCEVHENIHVKKNQTPYEAYSHDQEKYEQIKQRIKVLPWQKRRKFLQDKIDELDECISRELNDTRYICKEVVRYLKQLGGITVKGTKGRVTAALRHWWGLDTILDGSGSAVKNRADHRHHAIDAAVVAVTTKEHLRSLATSKYSDEIKEFIQPWPHFREELEEKVKHINVSHRPTKKTSGKLHEETSYGLTKEVIQRFQEGRVKKLGQNTWLCEEMLNYVYSRPLDELLKKVGDLDIVPKDAVNVIEALKQRIKSAEVDINDKEAKIPEGLFEHAVYIKTNSGSEVPVRKVRVRVPMSNMVIFTDKKGNPYRACPAGVKGGNHHVEIIEVIEKGQKKRVEKIVTRIEAAQRKREHKAVVQKNHGPNAKFICSLAMNDMVLLPVKNRDMELYRVQKMDANGTVCYRHHKAATLKDNSQRILQQAHKFHGKKVVVDMLGHVNVIEDT